MDWINKMVDTWHNLPALVFPQPEMDAVRRLADHSHDEQSSGADSETSTGESQFDHTDEYDEVHHNEGNMQHDNFLRGMLISKGAKKLQKSRKAGVSYWRHGAGCSCKLNQSEEFHDYVKCQTSRDKLVGYQPSALISELDAPGMGLDADCLSIFLKNAGTDQSNSTLSRPAPQANTEGEVSQSKGATVQNQEKPAQQLPRQSALNHTQSPEYADDADVTANHAHVTTNAEHHPVGIQPPVGVDDEVNINDLFDRQYTEITPQYSAPHNQQPHASNNHLAAGAAQGAETLAHPFNDLSVEALVNDISQESWMSLKALSDDLADKAVAANGIVDQEITQDLSLEAIKRMELIEIFGRSVLAAKAALKELAADSDEAVRAVVAQEYACPDETLVDLAHDASETVRLSVVANPKVPIEILETLTADDVPAVAQAAETALAHQHQAHEQGHQSSWRAA